ncbi:ankyrin repeat domain-containing protein [Chitinophaga arvensicola]|uniref:Ankyrin repeat-containing protein n=1 Tax=Chitinophaga arvensicola TaxID=29529 RepID=A0A1I0SAE9_9BACT|nr:ankyrin repeat domain-containing protein [Chitinophaga arvensicola]SEW53450.1 Ankyrin repeat-containing protein [Chitinophaga arvensicola]
MYEVTELTQTLRRGNLEDARQRLEQGEKLPANLADFDKRQITDTLLRAKAFDLVDRLVKDRVVDLDVYEYDKLDGSIFESIFRNLGDTPEELAFLESFLSRTDNINDAVADITLLELAFTKNAPLAHIELLVAAGCDLQRKDNYDHTYLYKVVRTYGIKTDKGLLYLDYLIRNGVDPNAGNVAGETPLHLVIGEQTKAYSTFLLEHGADLNQQNKKGESAFYTAIVHHVCTAELYKHLTQYAAPDFEMINNNGETIICGAIRMRSRGSESETALIKALIADGADIYQTSPWYSKGKAALDWVAEYPAEVLQAIMDTGAIELERRDDQGNTLLHKVCAYNVNYQQEAAKQLYRKVKLLIEAGADVNVTNDQDQTPFDLAAQDNLKSKTVELLLKHKS